MTAPTHSAELCTASRIERQVSSQSWSERAEFAQARANQRRSGSPSSAGVELGPPISSSATRRYNQEHSPTAGRTPVELSPMRTGPGCSFSSKLLAMLRMRRLSSLVRSGSQTKATSRK